VLIVQSLHRQRNADKGSIAVGKLAHFTLFSADIMKIPEPEILKTRTEMTMIGGAIVYEDRR
jgi:predicted amidohydrolase YtcJ